MTGIDGAIPLADSVLFEGYVLYPYRANDTKNLVRWQFGVLMPPAYATHDPSERATLRTELLVEGREVTLQVRARFLHVRQRTVELRDGAAFRTVPALDVGDATHLPGEEAEIEEAELVVPLPDGDAATTELEMRVPGGTRVELLIGPDGTEVGRLRHEWDPLTARLAVDVEQLPGPYGVRRARIALTNTSAWVPAPGPLRPLALRRALVAAHLLVSAPGGRFVSQLDPPEWARGYVAACRNEGCFPVLAGPAGTSDVVLASPIILYDHAEVAPESTVAFCDGLEMDELLALRTATLTEQEKREARGSDPRAAGIVEQADHLPPQLMDRLHGAIRSMSAPARPVAGPAGQDATERLPWWDPVADAAADPDTDTVEVAGVALGRGSPVVLRPGTRRADAQDMFLAGRRAHVEAVLNDVDGDTHLAVVLDDLVADAGPNPHGRFLYFAPDEVEPVGPA